MGCSQSMPPSASDSEAPKDILDEYVLGVKLGRGGFATVRGCSKVPAGPVKAWKENHAQMNERAVKILDMRNKEANSELSPSLQKAAHSEAFCWKAVGLHPNCVRLHDLFFAADFVYMVMEKCQGGLLQVLEAMPELTERGLGNIGAQMLLGIAHCHANKVVHRDIKPDNFLVGGADGVIKLADFGLSAIMPKQGAKLVGVFGTAPFMCPEMLKERPYDEKADVWSLGVVLYVLMYGQFPYMPKKPSSEAMKQLVIAGVPEPSYQPILQQGADKQTGFRSPDAVSLLHILLNRDAEKRPSAEETLHKPWIVSALQGSNMSDIELPSLHPMLHAAKKCGAFEVVDPTLHTQADERLNKLQVKRHGKHLPETPSNKRPQEEAANSSISSKNFPNFEPQSPNCSSKPLWESSSNLTRSTSCDSAELMTPLSSESDSQATPRTASH